MSGLCSTAAVVEFTVDLGSLGSHNNAMLTEFRRDLVAALERHVEGLSSIDASLSTCSAQYKTSILKIIEAFCPKYDEMLVSLSSDERGRSLRHLTAEKVASNSADQSCGAPADDESQDL